MDTLIRAARAYWRWNQHLWGMVRKAAVPIIVFYGIASMVLWVVGLNNGITLFLWAPAAWAWILCIGFAGAKLPR